MKTKPIRDVRSGERTDHEVPWTYYSDPEERKDGSWVAVIVPPWGLRQIIEFADGDADSAVPREESSCVFCDSPITLASDGAWEDSSGACGCGDGEHCPVGTSPFFEAVRAMRDPDPNEGGEIYE